MARLARKVARAERREERQAQRDQRIQERIQRIEAKYYEKGPLANLVSGRSAMIGARLGRRRQ